MPKKIVWSILLVIVVTLLVAFVAINKATPPNQDSFNFQAAAQAESPGASFLTDFARAKVTAITAEDNIANKHVVSFSQTVTVHFLTGPLAGHDSSGLTYQTASANQKLAVGQTVVVGRLPDAQAGTDSPYIVVDQYRLPSVAIFVVLFLLLALILGRVKGFTALIGLAFSVFVLIYFIVPHIVQGQNAIVITLVGSCIIAVVSIFLAHGFNQRTSLAVLSTIIVLAAAQGLAYGVIHYTHLFGNGSEEAYLLQIGSLGALDLRGILLSSIIIGSLGILDDVTTGQSATVEELYALDPKLSFLTLYKKAMSVGREHIASLINTLVLAYAGAFFPMFLLLVTTNAQPLWALLNSEFIAEEIVRALVGSVVLLLAVPLTTAMAAYYVTLNKTQNTISVPD